MQNKKIFIPYRRFENTQMAKEFIEKLKKITFLINWTNI